MRDEMKGEVACADCGLVFADAELVTTIPLAHAGVPAEGSGRGIGPFVGRGENLRRALGSTLTGTRDGQGRPLGWQRRYEFQHLRRVMQRQTARGADASLERSPARAAIQQAGDALGLPGLVVTEAERFLREATPKGILRGRNLPACVGASVYAACRAYAIPRTLGEVSRAVNARRSEVGRAFKVLHRGLGVITPAVSAHAFLSRYAEELALSRSVRSTVEELLEVAEKDPELSGLPTHGLVAAMLYLAADRRGEHRSRAQVARVSAVTEVTLRSTGRLLERLWSRERTATRP